MCTYTIENTHVVVQKLDKHQVSARNIESHNVDVHNTENHYVFACYQLSHNVALCTTENHHRIINIKATKLLCGCTDHSRPQRGPKYERHRTTMWFHRPQRTTIEPQLNFRTTMCTMLNQNHYVINVIVSHHVASANQTRHVDNAIQSHYVANTNQNHHVVNVI